MTTMLDDLTVALKAELVRQERKAKQGPSGRSVPIDYTSLARAALQAIREVDERSSVFYDGLSAMGGYNDSGPVEPWQAMIDAILEEKA
jgi:hypothetical protein